MWHDTHDIIDTLSIIYGDTISMLCPVQPQEYLIYRVPPLSFERVK